MDTLNRKTQYKSLLQSAEDGSPMDLNNTRAVCRVTIASPDTILQWSRRHCRQTDRMGTCKCGKTPLEQKECTFGEVKKTRNHQLPYLQA